MINKIKKIVIFVTCFGLFMPFFGYADYPPSVQLYANGSSTSPIVVSYNSSVNLTWSSSNVNYCQVSGDWSGTKNTSGSETIYNITSDRDFKITCSNSSGLATSEIEIDVTSIPTSFQVSKLVQNVSQGTGYSDAVSANPGDQVSFQIQLTAGNASLQDIIVKDTLPSNIIYLGDLKIDGISYYTDITSGINTGYLSTNQTKIITFVAKVANANQFYLGTTTLINSVLVYNSLFATSDTAKVMVYKAMGGGPTNISTGLSNNILFNSFILPLALTLLIVWLFKSHIINFEEWVELRKNKYRAYKARKILNKIRTQELLRENKLK